MLLRQVFFLIPNILNLNQSSSEDFYKRFKFIRKTFISLENALIHLVEKKHPVRVASRCGSYKITLVGPTHPGHRRVLCNQFRLSVDLTEPTAAGIIGQLFFCFHFPGFSRVPQDGGGGGRMDVIVIFKYRGTHKLWHVSSQPGVANKFYENYEKLFISC